jgi:hypothetical protein
MYQCDTIISTISYISIRDYLYICSSSYKDTLAILQATTTVSDNDMLEMKFISKVSTMGPDRLFIQIPKEQLKTAKGLKGKYVKVFLQEVTLEE